MGKNTAYITLRSPIGLTRKCGRLALNFDHIRRFHRENDLSDFSRQVGQPKIRATRE